MKKLMLLPLTILMALIWINSYAGGPAAPAPAKMRGLYIRGDVGGATLLSEDVISRFVTNRSRLRLTQEEHFNARNALSLTWDVGIGYFISRFASLDIIYRAVSFRMRSDNKVIRSNFARFPNTFSIGKGESDIVLANFYLYIAQIFNVISPWQPFIGGGVGWAKNNLEPLVEDGQAAGTNVPSGPRSIKQSGSECGLAWQVTLGFLYILHPHILLSVQYAYLNAGEYRPGRNFDVFGAGPPNPPTDTGSYIEKPNIPVRSNQFLVGLIFLM